MGKAEILAELPHLKAEELAEVQAALDVLVGDGWIDAAEPLSAADRAALDAALADHERNPEKAEKWPDVQARILTQLRDV